MEFNLNGVDNSSAVAVFHWLIYKNPHATISSPDPKSYDSTIKNQILKRGMEMLPEIPLGSGGTVQTKRIFVVKIPKSFQRMAELDQIKLNYASTSTSPINFCRISIFKEIQ